MLELGINNILGMQRTDTLYDPQDPKIKSTRECQDPSRASASFSLDGPAIKKLKVIEGLNALNPQEVRELRAFLYSL